jgi:glycosyltransferase involved in cell wall biosynthesis
MSKLQIVVPVFNRKKITELALTSLREFKSSDTKLIIYNDYSKEYDNDFLKIFTDDVIQLSEKKGVQHLRWYQFREFLKSDSDLLYFTDNDTVHSPEFEHIMLDIYKKYSLKNGEKMPICLYNTAHHCNKENQISRIRDLLIRKYTPGVSMLFDKESVNAIVTHLSTLDKDPDYAWDYRCLDFLKRPTITTETSYLEHFGAFGLHNKGEDYDRDRALNPTEYLVSIRENIIKYLKGKKFFTVKELLKL